MSLPTPPQRSDGPTEFADKGDAFVAALPVFESRMEAIDSNVTVKELAAAASAAAALASEQAATASRNASLWLAATAYVVGNTAYSPINGRVYRRTVSGTTATDPSADVTNWAVVDGGLAVIIVSTTAHTAGVGSHCILANVATTTLTLPASPGAGDTVWITVANSLTNNVIARNGKTIMGLAENMTIDADTATVQLRYVNNDWKIL